MRGMHDERSARRRRHATLAALVLVLGVAAAAPALAAEDTDRAAAPPIDCEPVGVFGPPAEFCLPSDPGGNGFTTPAPEQPSDTGHPIPDYSPPDAGYPIPDYSPPDAGYPLAPELPSDTGHPAPGDGTGPVIDANEQLKGAALERKVADLLGDDVIARNREVREGGKIIGEVDVETEDAIIEVTSQPDGKAGQVGKLVTNPGLNPEGKPVFLYAPNYTRGAGKAVEGEGGQVARDAEELLDLLEGLAGDE